MGFRTVVVRNRSKLDLKMGYLVCRGSETYSLFIPEISTLILETTSISLTCALVSELVKNNVKIIFCDEKHNPESELISYHGHYNSAKKIKQQLMWSGEIKKRVWAKIVKDKIQKQAQILNECKLFVERDMLLQYANSVLDNDVTNREGHAAKVYFNALFGTDFSRRVEHKINTALNYGYAVILSCFNRELAKMGYLTEMGIWHKNEFNAFNLSCDLVEPFRILVDRLVLGMDFGQNTNSQILEIFNTKVKIDNKMQFVENAISIYCQSIVEALNKGDEDLIKFYEL